MNCRRILCDENPLGHSSNDRPSRNQVTFDRGRSPFTALTRRDRSDGTCEAMSNGGSWAISEIRKCPLLEKTTGSKGSRLCKNTAFFVSEKEFLHHARSYCAIDAHAYHCISVGWLKS